MSNLLKMVTGGMSDGMIGKVASLIGSNAGVTKTALTALMPNILKGIASKGATEGGASSLLSMIKDHGFGSGNMDLSSDLMGKGGKLNDSIFGSSLKDINVPGLGGEAKSKLMNLATPMALGSLGKVVKEKNLDAKGLSSYLQSEVKGTATAAKATTARATEKVSHATSSAASTAKQTASGGMGFLKWALPLLLLLGALWYFLNKPKAVDTTPAKTTTTQPAKTTTTKTTHTHSDGTVHQGATHGGTTTTTTTQAGDAVKGAAGNVMDKAKGAAGAAGDAVKGAAGTAGDAVKGAAGAAGDAVKGAAGKAGDAAGNVLDKAKNAAGAAGDAAGKVGGAAGDAVKGAANKAGDVLDAAKKGTSATTGAAGAKDIRGGGN